MPGITVPPPTEAEAMQLATGHSRDTAEISANVTNAILNDTLESQAPSLKRSILVLNNDIEWLTNAARTQNYQNPEILRILERSHASLQLIEKMVRIGLDEDAA
ncbi:MAG: hypothetical protein HC848_08335 [Limnobacter sp.]|nr:hypothetical protein [Limnobacter sp.]